MTTTVECHQFGAPTVGTAYCHNCTTMTNNNFHSLTVGLPELQLIAGDMSQIIA